jgi:hypothetical protein
MALAEIKAEAPKLALMPDDYFRRLIDAEIAYEQVRSHRQQVSGHVFIIVN